MIKLTYIGIDGWDRLVFKGDNDRYYKTTSLEPEGGFETLTSRDQSIMLMDLHTTDGPDGEPDYPCWKEGKFELVEAKPAMPEEKLSKVMNYDPNLVFCGRMTIQTIRLTFGEFRHRKTMEVTVNGNCRGLGVIEAAVNNAYDELPENKPFMQKVITLTDEHGDELDVEEEDHEWLQNMLISAEIIDIKSLEAKQ